MTTKSSTMRQLNREFATMTGRLSRANKAKIAKRKSSMNHRYATYRGMYPDVRTELHMLLIEELMLLDEEMLFVEYGTAQTSESLKARKRNIDGQLVAILQCAGFSGRATARLVQRLATQRHVYDRERRVLLLSIKQVYVFIADIESKQRIQDAVSVTNLKKQVRQHTRAAVTQS